VTANNEHITLKVPADMAGQRLDQTLASLCDLSRSRIQELLKQGHILQGTKVLTCKASMQVLQGDNFTIALPANQSLELTAENIPLHILFEDEHLLVVNKPAGMVVHPSHGHDSGTLVHALLHHCDSLPGINGVERPGIVHRLDKDTSGSLVVAKTEAAHHGLSQLFANHDIDRQYIAWCKAAPHWNELHIDEPIARHPKHRQKMAIVHTGKTAITDALLEQRFDQQFSRIRLTLHTGRTHQIRVHLSSLGFPVLGDTMYGRPFKLNQSFPESAQNALEKLSRQALHAEVLGFIHPVTAESIHCTAPLPDDLQQLNQAFESAFG